MKKPADSEVLRNKLKLKSLEAKKSFFQKYPHVGKYLKKQGIDLTKIREHSAKIIGASAVTGALLLSPPSNNISLPAPKEITKTIDTLKRGKVGQPTQSVLMEKLQEILPQKVGPLNYRDEKLLEKVFKDVLGINAKANLEGEHLNTTYGYIGVEQNLMRYPGDRVANMAPGRGAWGYFANSKAELTPDLIEKEKWYAVVQTLYLPDWSSRLAYLRDWYKYRKVLIVNTRNGNAVVADIADAGPAAWTGKQFGGSPEVMNYLGGSKYKKGPVLVFFVDDPQNKVPLGPVEYNKTSVPLVASEQT